MVKHIPITMSPTVSAGQFIFFRKIFGIYLTIHFLQLWPDASELFSRNGALPNAQDLPTYGKVPSFLFLYDDPLSVYLFILSMTVASVLLTLGKFQRISATWIFFGWVSLWNRNPFISNPSLAYIGWILLSFILVEAPQPKKPWKFPSVIYHGYWIIVSMSYTVSGLHKLQCPSWVDGSALQHILTSLLSRDNFIVHTLLSLPAEVLRWMTWVSLFAEISFLFLGLFKHLRKLYWFFFFSFHLGILTTVSFSDLTLGMLISHLYLFDRQWLTRIETKVTSKANQLCDFVLKGELPTSTANTISTTEEKICTRFAVLVGVFFVYFLVADGGKEMIASLTRFQDLTVNSLWGFGYTVLGLGVLMILERLFPDQILANSPNWWQWVVGINIFQLFAVIVATFTWEKWFRETSYFTSTTGFHLRDHVSPFFGGFMAYLLNQWLFYWWHFLRHQVYLLWIFFHQFHHSPTRIEAITSFYKHPLEIVVDSQIMAALLYCVLGLGEESSIWLSLFSAFGEYVYHMNIRTPRIMGYFFQRPESHRIHHRQNRRVDCPNYSDFPLFDMLNGTFENPDRMDEPTGFSGDKELDRWKMISFKDVLHPLKSFDQVRTLLCYLLVSWGLFSSTALFLHSPLSQQSAAFVSSPLPLVFSSFKGVETFSTTFDLSVGFTNATRMNIALDVERYSQLTGSYHRRNIYGAIFAFGPFFDTPQSIKMRQDILHYGICEPGLVRQEMGMLEPIRHLNITVKSKTRGERRQWNLEIECCPAV